MLPRASGPFLRGSRRWVCGDLRQSLRIVRNLRILRYAKSMVGNLKFARSDLNSSQMIARESSGKRHQQTGSREGLTVLRRPYGAGDLVCD